MKPKKEVQLGIRINHYLHEELLTLAERTDLSMSRLIRILLDHALKSEDLDKALDILKMVW